MPHFTAPAKGRVEIFVVNESSLEVWFDDLKIKFKGALIAQETHYDPWGLELAGIGKAGLNRFTFNAQSEKQKDLNGGKGYFYETDFRGYDPQLGRFHGYDLLASAFSGITPYQFGFNNPVRFNDPTGLEAEEADGGGPGKQKRKRKRAIRQQKRGKRVGLPGVSSGSSRTARQRKREERKERREEQKTQSRLPESDENAPYNPEMGFPVPHYIKRSGIYYSPELESAWERTQSNGMHYALDIHFGVATLGDSYGKIPVYATMNGIVDIQSLALGNVTVSNGFVMTGYMHLQTKGDFAIQVRDGQKINAGDIIGYIGSTATSGPHLHYEILIREDGSIGKNFGAVGWRNINPLDGVNKAQNYPKNLSLQSYQMRLKQASDPFLLTRQQLAILHKRHYVSLETLFQFYRHNIK